MVDLVRRLADHLPTYAPHCSPGQAARAVYLLAKARAVWPTPPQAAMDALAARLATSTMHGGGGVPGHAVAPPPAAWAQQPPPAQAWRRSEAIRSAPGEEQLAPEQLALLAWSCAVVPRVPGPLWAQVQQVRALLFFRYLPAVERT